MFVFYGIKSKKELEIFKNKYNYCLYYRENIEFYLRYGIATPKQHKVKGYTTNKYIYTRSKGMQCIDFEDFIKFIK